MRGGKYTAKTSLFSRLLAIKEKLVDDPKKGSSTSFFV